MNTTDPIADMLTRIRNANSAKFKTVDIPASKMKRSIAEILFNEGYIKSYEEISNENQGILRISLKYTENGKKVISGLKRISSLSNALLLIKCKLGTVYSIVSPSSSLTIVIGFNNQSLIKV